MSRQSSPSSSSEAPELWRPIPWGDSFIAATRLKSPQVSQIVSVIDLGSNSLKQAIFDQRMKSLSPIDEQDTIAALAAGMKPNDLHARLSEKGLNILFTEALPRFMEKHKKFQVDTIVVVCTEAMRSAHLSDPDAVNLVRQKIADQLGIPSRAINLAKDDEEARLAASAALIENPNDEFVMMQGGGSTELARNPLGASDECFRRTLRFGTRTLVQQPHIDKFLRDEFSHVDWFKPLASSPAGSYGITDDRYGSICLLGGAFRPIGRLLCQRINNTPFYNTASYGGRRFLWNAVLENHLKSLTHITPEQLKYEFVRWGNPETRHMTDAKLKPWLVKNYTPWIANPIQIMGSNKAKATTIGEVWHEKVARRAGGIPSAARTILAAVEAVRPHEIVFGNGNIREAIFLEPRR